MDPVWDPERLRIAGDVMARYSEYLAPGHRVRVSMEGDPCLAYPSIDDAPVATVTRVYRRADDGFVEFDATNDSTGEVLRLNNRSVDPKRGVWEINPPDLEAYRASIVDEDAEDERYGKVREEIGRLRDEFSILGKIQNDLEALKQDNLEFRSTVTESLRMLAGDVAAYSPPGQGRTFSREYVDRFDVASRDSQHEKYEYPYEGSHNASDGKSSADDAPAPLVFQGSSNAPFREADELTDPEVNQPKK